MPDMCFRLQPDGRLIVSIIWADGRILQYYNRTVDMVIRYGAVRGGDHIRKEMDNA